MSNKTLPNSTKIDRFIIERPLSMGGGTSGVYLAQVDGTTHKVAVKVAHTEPDSTSHEDMLLQWEVGLLQKWDWRHPGIVRIYPIPLQERRPEYAVRATCIKPDEPWYMVMEYLRGESLGKNFSTINKFPLEWKLELFYNILLPVAFIHQKGYAHRDLKPDNIVFRCPVTCNTIPDPVLVDFALTTSGEEQRTIIDNAYTLEYASPERVIRSMPSMDSRLSGGTENVQASDIWSLGVILYEILSGKLLFKGNRERIRTTIIREKMEPELPIRDERGHILAAFIRQMLNREPERRPTIKQIIYALEEKFLPPRVVVQ